MWVFYNLSIFNDLGGFFSLMMAFSRTYSLYLICTPKGNLLCLSHTVIFFVSLPEVLDLPAGGGSNILLSRRLNKVTPFIHNFSYLAQDEASVGRTLSQSENKSKFHIMGFRCFHADEIATAVHYAQVYLILLFPHFI